MPGVAQLPQLAGKTRGEGLAPRLAALAAADKQRLLAPVELEVAPLERAELGATQPGRDEGEQRELVTLREAGQVPLGPAGGIEQVSELLGGQPVALLARLWRRLKIEEGIGAAVPPADPAEEPAQEEEAPVVGRLRRARPLLVRAQVVDDRRLLEDAPPARLRPVEQIVDRDSVGDERALALLLGLEPP